MWSVLEPTYDYYVLKVIENEDNIFWNKSNPVGD